MSFNCEIMEQPAQPVLSIRARTPIENLPNLLGEAYGKIVEYLTKLGEQPIGAPFAAYYNMDMQDLDVEIGFPVAKIIAGEADIQASEVPGGKLASVMHIGPYKDISPAYEALTQFSEMQGYKPTGVSYEFYLNDPEEIPQDKLQTQIVFPLQ